MEYGARLDLSGADFRRLENLDQLRITAVFRGKSRWRARGSAFGPRVLRVASVAPPQLRTNSRSSIVYNYSKAALKPAGATVPRAVARSWGGCHGRARQAEISPLNGRSGATPKETVLVKRAEPIEG